MPAHRRQNATDVLRNREEGRETCVAQSVVAEVNAGQRRVAGQRLRDGGGPALLDAVPADSHRGDRRVVCGKAGESLKAPPSL